MPFINAKISVKATAEQLEAFKADMGSAIGAFPGKSEKWLMVNVEDEAKLWFAGNNDAPSAMVSVDLFGLSVDPLASQKMTELICGSLRTNFDISPDRAYVKYAAFTAWGWNNSNF